jgi:hypothetical protein
MQDTTTQGRKRGRPKNPTFLWAPAGWLEVADLLGIDLPEVRQARPIVDAFTTVCRASDFSTAPEPPEVPQGLAIAVWSNLKDQRGFDPSHLQAVHQAALHAPIASRSKGGRPNNQALQGAIEALVSVSTQALRKHGDVRNATRLVALLLMLFTSGNVSLSELPGLRVVGTCRQKPLSGPERVRLLSKHIGEIVTGFSDEISRR